MFGIFWEDLDGVGVGVDFCGLGWDLRVFVRDFLFYRVFVIFYNEKFINLEKE